MVAALLPTTVFADGDVNYNTQFDVSVSLFHRLGKSLAANYILEQAVKRR